VSLVLVDTSVWTRALSDQARYADLRQRLDALLEAEEVARHEFVHGELLIGNRSETRTRMLVLYRQCADLRAVAHDHVVAFVTAQGLTGRGLSWIDGHLLAAAVVHRVTLWSTDRALVDAARQLGRAFA
jgi:predicted nucleic acid-binding protein